jgi:hypothetical protein
VAEKIPPAREAQTGKNLSADRALIFLSMQDKTLAGAVQNPSDVASTA